MNVPPLFQRDAPPTVIATAQESCTMRHFQPFLCRWCPPQCQTCHICQKVSKMKVQHLENKCQNWSKLGAYLKTDKSIPVYFQSSISKGKINLAYNWNIKMKWLLCLVCISTRISFRLYSNPHDIRINLRNSKRKQFSEIYVSWQTVWIKMH